MVSPCCPEGRSDSPRRSAARARTHHRGARGPPDSSRTPPRTPARTRTPPRPARHPRARPQPLQPRRAPPGEPPASLHTHPEPMLQSPDCFETRKPHGCGRPSSQACCQNGTHCPGCRSQTPPAALIPTNTTAHTPMYAKCRRRGASERPSAAGSNRRSTADRAARSIAITDRFSNGTCSSLPSPPQHHVQHDRAEPVEHPERDASQLRARRGRRVGEQQVHPEKHRDRNVRVVEEVDAGRREVEQAERDTSRPPRPSSSSSRRTGTGRAARSGRSTGYICGG